MTRPCWPGTGPPHRRRPQGVPVLISNHDIELTQGSTAGPGWTRSWSSAPSAANGGSRNKVAELLALYRPASLPSRVIILARRELALSRLNHERSWGPLSFLPGLTGRGGSVPWCCVGSGHCHRARLRRELSVHWLLQMRVVFTPVCDKIAPFFANTLPMDDADERLSDCPSILSADFARLGEGCGQGAGQPE